MKFIKEKFMDIIVHDFLETSKYLESFIVETEFFKY